MEPRNHYDIENTLKKEEKCMEEFAISKMPGNEHIAELSGRNIALAQSAIHLDSRYKNATNEEARPSNISKDDNLPDDYWAQFNSDKHFIGSSAYWIRKQFLPKYNVSPNEKICSDIMLGIIRSLDRENSTHLNSAAKGSRESSRGWYAVTKRLTQYTYGELVYLLQADNAYEVVKRIAIPTEIGERKHLSFASKFCHYMCFNLFKKSSDDMYLIDKFPIYDSVLAQNLPPYLAANGLVNPDGKIDFSTDSVKDDEQLIDVYRRFDDALSELAKKVGHSKNGIDDLIWYYHK